MADKKIKKLKLQKTANASSFLAFFFMNALYYFETQRANIRIDFTIYVLVTLLVLVVIIAIIKNTVNHNKLAFNIPIILSLFYISLMMMCNWNAASSYLFICFLICVISCIYSSFYRTLAFILFQNALILFFVLRGVPFCGPEVSLNIVLVNWAVFILGCIIILVITRSATIILDKSVEHQNSFRSLLNTMENFVTMIDEHNQVVYASKTMSMLGNVEEPTLVQGRPLLDLLPGKSLKILAGKLLSEKENYAEDWEFFLDGQKRYFKAASHSLQDGSGGTLISLYDMTSLAERDEIAAMKDSLKIGIFFMNHDYIIEDHYSRYLEEMLSEQNLFGKQFTSVIADSVTNSELQAIKDYFDMVFENTYDQDMLEDINPLTQLHYVNASTGTRKVLQCAFTTVERGHGEVFILVTIYDITAQVELQQRLAEEEAKRQEEIQSVFELIQVEPDVFADFMEDMEHEFDTIDKIMKSDELSTHDMLVKTYQSVHAIKSNAVILGLNIFGNKMHNLEAKIKKLRETEDVPFAEMLNLTLEIEKISQEKERFREIIGKLQSYGGGSPAGGTKQNLKVMVESLAKAASRAAEDMERQIQFVASDIDPEAIDVGPRRIMKDILMQLVRNSAVHGIEKPDERKAKGKNETGVIKLSIKMTEDHHHIHIKYTDDGKGLDYKRIAEKALKQNLIKKEDADKTDLLIKAIFAPGFSTAETEGVHAGRGIGLNLVRDRIKEVNGTIKLRSETGKGTIFFISIPVRNKE